MSIFLNWQITPVTGWGNYGTQLALGVLARKRPVFAMARTDVEQYPPLVRRRIELVRDLEDMRKVVKEFGVRTFVQACGNGGAIGEMPEGVIAENKAAAIFFEDTAWTEEQLDTLRAFPVVVCGSTWNEQVLRAKGLTNVTTVIQGVDPSVWHPAPRSGAFGGRFAVFSGGKLEFRKGQDIVIAAFRKFRAKHPDALLVTAWQNVWPQTMEGIDLGGHAAGMPKVRPGGGIDVSGWLVKNGIPQTAHVDVGLLSNHVMAPIVRECDLAVFPNRAEGGTNLVAMECIAAGVPTACAMNTGQLDLRDSCIPLDDQGTVPRGCSMFKEAEGWGETSVDELLAVMERAYRKKDELFGRAVCEDRGRQFAEQFSWQGNTVPKLLAAIEPNQKQEAA